MQSLSHTLILQAILTFARATNAALQDFDVYMGIFVNFDDTPWRRSALAFLVGMCRLCSLLRVPPPLSNSPVMELTRKWKLLLLLLVLAPVKSVQL